MFAFFILLYGSILIPRALLSPALSRRLGTMEYLFGHLRDHTVGLVAVTLAAYDLTSIVFGAPFGISQLAHVLVAQLSILSHHRHVESGLAMTEFMRVNPTVHPQEFFDRYYDRLGPRTEAPPTKAQQVIDPRDVSFMTGAPPKQSLLPLLRGLFDTAIFARSAYRTLTACGSQYGREVFDAMATLWGSRMLQLFGSRLTVKGLETFAQLEGKVVLAFNHKSHLDFVFAFFALATARMKNGRRLRVRYIAAKDHFVDNVVVYSWLAVGRLIEAVDMVFVDRKGKGQSAIDDAARKLASLPIDIAIFPQGTRALAHIGPNGERLDAGYYTASTKTDSPLAHLKKGAAHLALETAELTEAPVHIVCIGIQGTATLVPKGKFPVQSETHVTFEVAGVLTIDPANPPEIDTIQRTIDQHLTRVLRINEVLLARLEEVDPSLHITSAGPRLFSALDFACAAPPHEHRLEHIARALREELAAVEGSELRAETDSAFLRIQ
jgi:1-acyl-sn-glycerol-3-phosphate acyltransferase